MIRATLRVHKYAIKELPRRDDGAVDLERLKIILKHNLEETLPRAAVEMGRPEDALAMGALAGQITVIEAKILAEPVMETDDDGTRFEVVPDLELTFVMPSPEDLWGSNDR